MRQMTKLYALSRIATVFMIVGGGLACELAPRIAPPPAGRVLWKVRGEGFPVVPSYDSATVFFASKDHQIVAIDRRAGTVRWKSSTGNGPGGATGGFNSVVAGDVVVLGDVDLYAFNRTTGTLAWSFRASDDDETGSHALGTDGTVVYASSYFGRVYALDSHSGLPTWVTQLSGPGDVRTTTFDPVAGGGQVFVGLSHDTNPSTGGLAALDAATGRLLWVREFTPRIPDLGSDCNGGVVLAGGLVIASADDGQIYGLDTATGAVRWVAPPIPRYPTGDDRALALANGLVIASSNSGFATGIDAATGAIRWSVQIDGASLTYHVSTDAQLAVFSTLSGEIITADPQTGEVRWRTGLGKEGGNFWGYDTVAPDQVFANGYDGFYALKKE
jgi:outer membrane protein assembly factor BamB